MDTVEIQGNYGDLLTVYTDEDLTGIATVSLWITKPDHNTTVNLPGIALEPLTGGVFTVQITPGTFDQLGDYMAQAWLQSSTRSTRKEAFIITVKPVGEV